MSENSSKPGTETRNRWFRDLPIRRKMMTLMVTLAAIALLLSATISVLTRRVAIKEELVGRYTSLTRLIARSCIVPLEFPVISSEGVDDNLKYLEAEPDVLRAWGFNENREIVGEYVASGHETHGEMVAPPTPLKQGHHFSNSGYVDVFQPVITDEGREIGIICLRGSTARLSTEMLRTFEVAAITFGVLLILAAFLSAALQGFITKPVSVLANATRKVSTDGDYSVRVEKHGNDEIGILADGFNAMLEKIEQRDIELERSNRDLDDFAYISSHDLREPLRGIAHQASRLMKTTLDQLDAEGKQRLERIVDLTERLDEFIASLLRYSRVGRQFELEKVNFEQVVQDVRGRLEELFVEDRSDEKSVELRVADSFPTIQCNRQGAVEIIQNLITNGIKYNDKEQKRIELGWCPLDKVNLEWNPIPDGDPRLPVFYVRDNGLGIRKKDFERVFKIFTQLQAREKFGGTGVGLTIVKRWVEKHGGTIWLESTQGEGTTFYFTLQDHKQESTHGAESHQSA